jgi:hypothetical protein
MFAHAVTMALDVWVIFTLVALFPFGYVKGRVTGLSACWSGWQTMLIAGVAAGSRHS